MTQPVPLPLPFSLTSTTHHKYHLTPTAALAPSVLAVTSSFSSSSSAAAAAATAAPTPLALKTLTLPDDAAVAIVLADFAAWRLAHALSPTRLVRPIDVCVDHAARTVHLLMELCPGGPLRPAARPERAALRLIAAVADAVAAVLAAPQSAHANVAPAHVLFDAAGNPKLAGFGFTRARRLASPRRALSERDDVRALGVLLFELLYGRRYEGGSGVLSEPSVSAPTCALLKSVLAVEARQVPELAVFRYDVAAARKLVPVCSAPLRPLANGRPELILGADLDSVRGLEEERSEANVDEQIGSRSRAAGGTRTKRDEVGVPNGNVRGEVGEPTILTGKAAITRIVQEGETLDDSAIDALTRRVTVPDPSPSDQGDIQGLVNACATSADAAEKILKVLFTLPISKNPIVAFKVATLVHHLLAEGPATTTALAITHDGFLKWIQTCWARERLQNKSGKTHMLSYCFAAGEIAMYTAALRKRTECHGKFAQVLSTHWVPRADGLPQLQTTRPQALEFLLDIIEKCAALVRKALASKDPMARLKQAGVPLLAVELAKCYHASCWLFATEDEEQRLKLTAPFSVVHRTTKTAMEAIRGAREIAAACPSNALLDLEEAPPEQFDVQALVAALKKKKKKKKKKSHVRSTGADAAADDSGGDEIRHEADGSNAEKEQQESTDDENEIPVVSSIERDSRTSRRKKSDVRGASRARSEHRPGENGRASHDDGPYASPRRDAPELNGMAKLSLSVRKGETGGHDVSVPTPTPAPFSGRAPKNFGTRARSAPPRRDLSTSGVPNGNSGAKTKDVHGSKEGLASKKNQPNGYGSARARRGRSPRQRRPSLSEQTQNESGSDSESSHDEEEPTPAHGRRGKVSKSKLVPNGDDGEWSGEDGMSSKSQNSRSRRKPHVEGHVDEKSIPFDKDPPRKKKTGAKKGVASGTEEEYSGGSKAALAAAASGKKTPSINPKFEVAPYEVQFGPQVGSGGFGVVFKAKFRTETVAIKRIHAHALSNASSVAEFQSEVAVLCTLRHPNILRFVGACTKPPHLMIITEFMAKGTLFDVLHQSQMRVTWPMRKKFALDTCKGMRYLHDSKLLHRDLKSSNLMLDKDFNCKVGDFGLTRISRGAAAVQMTGQCGTFQYMAVEVLANKPYSEKADVFSFGILLWEMVSRKLPYFGMQPMQVGIAVMQRGMRPPIPPKCPQPLVKLMQACWDSDPARRPSFAQLVQALEAMPE